MKICIPTVDDRGLESTVAGHFGSAPFFATVDTDSGRLEVERNPDRHHHHRSCHHGASLEVRGIDAVVCTGMGRRALSDLLDAGIEVLAPGQGTVAEIIEAVRAGKTRRLTLDDACGGGRHGRGNGSGHGLAHRHGNCDR